MATTFTVEVYWDSSWVDESSRTQRVEVKTGFDRASDAVAAVGTCRITLDNTDQRFSPGYASSPLYGDLLPRREVRVTAASGGSTWTLFRGFIERIVPGAGEFGDPECVIDCVDAMRIVQHQRISVVHADSKDVDQAVSAVVSAAYTPPATSYADNGDTLVHYGRSWLAEKTTCLEALREICTAVYGRFYVARDGTATYISRDDRLDSSVAAAATWSNQALETLDVRMDVNRIINLAQVTVHPVETASATMTLWTARTVLTIPANGSRTIFAPFRDENGERVGAVDVIDPVATTDYTINDQSDGSGFDYTNSPSITITTTVEATRAKFVITSTATGNLYFTLLKIRGKAIRVYDPITIEQEDSTSQTAYEIRAAQLDLAMIADPVFGVSYAEYLVGRFANPVLEGEYLAVENQDALNSVNVFSIELLDKLVLSDTHTGMSSLGHWVRGVAYDIRGAGFRAGLYLERADDRIYCILDKAGYCELDSVRVGF